MPEGHFVMGLQNVIVSCLETVLLDAKDNTRLD